MACERADVHVWDHETDERSPVAPDLAGYVRRALESGGEDWYRQPWPGAMPSGAEADDRGRHPHEGMST
ncbi:hypothetical protein ABZ408_22685 [Streptomyces tibetensis]|uniref:Uncharacterized protein n=1 Tax=Streptomyces tibetensis TaxID=2382123 RepID=A0ABW6N498_9ACTN